VWRELDSCGLGKGNADGCCEPVNELAGYIKFGGICWFVKDLVVFREGFCMLLGVVSFAVMGLVG
jgi:hypothetical protein